MPVSKAKVFTPKEFNMMIEVFDEPDWPIIDAYLRGKGH